VSTMATGHSCKGWRSAGMSTKLMNQRRGMRERNGDDTVAKSLSSAQQLRKLKSAAKTKYKVSVEENRFVVAMNRDLIVSGVPIRAKSGKPFDNIALINVEAGFKAREKLAIPAGVYKLTKTARKSALKDGTGEPVVTGDVHAAPLSIPIGDITITIGGGKVCVYWDDPIDPQHPGVGQCHCHCVVLTKKTVA
jgi:hypothetical protein